MGDGFTHVDMAVQNVLTGSRLLMAHPGAAKFNQLYASADKSTTNLAECVNSRGRLRFDANNLALGGRSDFYISSSSIVNDFMLNVSYQVPASGVVTFGWLFQAIQEIQITYSNSLIQNVVIAGPILREYLLLSCTDREARDKLIRNAGKNVNDALAWASIPIPLLNQNASGVRGNYGLDMSVLGGPITISIIWNKSSVFVRQYTDGNNPLVPIEVLTSANVTAQTSDLQSSGFAVKTAMNLNPALVYSIPARYVNCIPYTFSAIGNNAQSVQVLNLNSAPAGMLESIIFSIRPNIWSAAGNNYRFPGGSFDIDTLQLTYGSQVLYEWRSYEECCNLDLMVYGDTLQYFEGYSASGAVALANLKLSKVYHIPLSHDARQVISGHLVENLPSYSGATLQLRFTIAAQTRTVTVGNIFNEASTAVGAQSDYTVYVGYVLTSILEISNGTVDMQL